MNNVARGARFTRDDTSLRIRALDRVLFAKRLALYLRAGIPLLEALALLVQGSRSGTYRRVLSGIYASVQKGKPLSQSMQQYPRSFAALHSQLVAVGELTGSLSETLSYLADMLTSSMRLRREIIAALLYPAILLCGTVTVSGFLIFYAFPKITPLFRGLHTELPVTTRALLSISQHWMLGTVVLLLSIVGSVAVGYAAARNIRMRHALHTTLLSLPGIRSTIQSYNVALLFRLLAVMQHSGARIDVTVRLAHTAWRNEVYRASLRDLEETVLAGGKITTALKRFPRAYPPVVLELIAAGEATGSLANSARTIADLYQEQLQEHLGRLSTLLEPVLILVMGGVVGFVALAIISPIYSLTQSLSL